MDNGTEKKNKKRIIILVTLWVVFIGLATAFVVSFINDRNAENEAERLQNELNALKETKPSAEPTPLPTPTPTPVPKKPDATPTPSPTPTPVPPAVMLPDYEELYAINNDMIGWLRIDDTVIDYPVMQTPEDEEYYLHRDFYGEESVNGTLLLDTDSQAGTGTLAAGYLDGTPPTTNLIIHGHTMRSGKMFGKLSKYEDEEYGKAHSTIYFDTLYEHREYELIAVFRSQVYKKSQDVFKYYKFFEANTQEEFDNWYENIRALSVYDTGVTAEWGDEFITLSCCAYHVDNGRFVVVGKRKK